jgi:hypothetical protein
MSEVWKAVQGYEGIYEVSSAGNVRSKDRMVKLSDARVRCLKGRLLSPKKNGNGYVFVSLSKDGVAETHYIHRLVAQAFIPNEENKSYVNHLDGAPRNNQIDNLEWVTHAENVQHAYDTGLNKNKAGNHHFAVGVIDNALGQEFATIKEWCAARGINYSTGKNIASGCNKSKVIDLSEIVIRRTRDNENGQ